MGRGGRSPSAGARRRTQRGPRECGPSWDGAATELVAGRRPARTWRGQPMRRFVPPVPTRRRRPSRPAPLAATRARARALAAAALAAALCAAGAGSHPLPAQARPTAPAPTPAGSAILAGLIVDMSGRPIAGVQVLLVELGASVATDTDGAFVFAGAPA